MVDNILTLADSEPYHSELNAHVATLADMLETTEHQTIYGWN